MKRFVLFFLVSLGLASCQRNGTVNAIEGEWTPVDLVPMPNEIETSDDSLGMGLFVAAMAMSAPEHFLFRSDSLYLDGKFMALYKVADGKVDISFDEKSVSSNIRLKEDSMWLSDFPEEGATMVFKRP